MLIDYYITFAFWINATTFGSLIAFAVIIGLVIGVGSSLAQPLAADVLDHKHTGDAEYILANEIDRVATNIIDSRQHSTTDLELQRRHLHLQDKWIIKRSTIQWIT